MNATLSPVSTSHKIAMSNPALSHLLSAFSSPLLRALSLDAVDDVSVCAGVVRAQKLLGRGKGSWTGGAKTAPLLADFHDREGSNCAADERAGAAHELHRARSAACLPAALVGIGGRFANAAIDAPSGSSANVMSPFSRAGGSVLSGGPPLLPADGSSSSSRSLDGLLVHVHDDDVSAPTATTFSCAPCCAWDFSECGTMFDCAIDTLVPTTCTLM